MSRDDELRDLLSALLDGELDAVEEREVRDLLDRSALARDELAGLSRVRLLVRDLDDVEPPVGFLDTVTPASAATPASVSPRGAGTGGGFTDLGEARAQRARRRRWPLITGAAVAAAAAIVLLLGLTPVTDKVVPPVEAYAARHASMADGTAPAPAAPSAFTPVAPAELDRVGAPAHVDAGYDRMGGYHTTDGVMHVMYEKPGSADVVSIYVQRGQVSWEALPAGGAMMPMGAAGPDPAWEMDGPAEDVMVVERSSMVYTIVAVDHAGMMDVLQAMPPPPAPSMMDRVRQACRSVVERVGLGD